MSINYNRARFNAAQSNSDYKILILQNAYPIYYDECWTYYPYKHSARYKKGRKKQILMYQVRMYKTWKHNRKKQYKNEKD